jgi:hypothetical protein
MTESLASSRVQTGDGARRAVEVWGDLQDKGIEPTGVDVLKKGGKSAVYRLEGVGPGRTAVIAKWCDAQTLMMERVIYEQVLPHLPLSRPQYYGSAVDSGGEGGWLFLEDMRGEPYSRGTPSHCTLAAEWFGTMHTAALREDLRTILPDRGPSHYMGHLRTGRDFILSSLRNGELAAEDAAVLRRIVSQCDVVESRWDEITAMCAGTPRTLVHGDFKRKNARVRTEATGPRFLIVDWEMAGWGVPGVDLAQWGMPAAEVPATSANGPSDALLAYRSVVSQAWPRLTAEDIRLMAQMGAIFRMLAAIDWKSLSLAYPPAAAAVRDLQLYESMFGTLIRTFGWEQ